MIVHFITFLRHGESEGNQSGLLQGQTDYPLTPVGVEQAKALASYWNSQEMKFDLIISSPLVRASQTAEIIANRMQVLIEFDPAWKERNFGLLQGAGLQEIDHRTPPVDFFHPYDPIGDNGESQLDLYIRAAQALQSIIRQPAGSYLVVSHGGILNKAMYVVMGITPQGHYNSLIFHFGNTGYAQLRYFSLSRQWTIISLNSHIATGLPEGIDSWKQD
jgi:broad specificity phosphatase PhoE